MKFTLSVAFLIITCSLSQAQSNTFPSSGSVGIGTTSPSYNLDVNGSWAFRQNGYFYNSAAYAYESSTNQYLHFQTSGGKGYVGMTSTNDLILQSYGGKVGIGTGSPIAKLHVKTSSSSALVFERSGANVFGYEIGGSTFGLYDYTNSQYRWRTNNADVLLVETSGNVGIGTTAPDAKLTVKGIIHAEEVKVDLAVPGPDYVFDESYPLRSLEDTKAYIDQNKHLPGIPSSDQMQQNGVNLLEMNMKLLEKVEELTLHLIEQDRRNNTLQTELLQLKEEMKELKSAVK